MKDKEVGDWPVRVDKRPGLSDHLQLWEPVLSAWLPVLAWMGVIFLFSAQPTLPQAPTWTLDVLLKKSGHALEYAILAYLLARAWTMARPGSLNRQRPIIATPATPTWQSLLLPVLGFSLLYALSDEWHQAFVPGRSPRLLDWLVDGSGAVLGLAAFSRLHTSSLSSENQTTTAFPPGRPAFPWQAAARFLLGTVISLGCLWLAVRNVEWDKMVMAITQARPELILLTLISVLVNITAKAYRWGWFFAGKKLPLRHLYASLLIGQLLNLVLPSRLGDLARAYALGRQTGESKPFVLGTIVAEKLVELICLLLLMLTLLATMTLPHWLDRPGSMAILTTVLLITGTVAVITQKERILRWAAWFRPLMPAAWHQRLLHALERGIAGMNLVQSRPAIVGIVFWSGVVWFTAALTNYLLFNALNVPAPIHAAAFLLVVLQIGITVPSSPGRLGVFEYLTVLALSVFGISETMALTCGLVLHALVFAPPILLGTMALWYENLTVRQIQQAARNNQ